MPSKSQSDRSDSSALAELGIHQSTACGIISTSFLNASVWNPGVRQDVTTNPFRARIGSMNRTAARTDLPLEIWTARQTSVRRIPNEPQMEMGVRTHPHFPRTPKTRRQ